MEPHVVQFSLSMLNRDNISPSKNQLTAKLSFVQRRMNALFVFQQDMENP